MKHNLKPLVAALSLFAMLFALAFAAEAQEREQTLVLRQDLGQSINTVNVYGLHNVSVIPDTMDFIQTTINGVLSQADSLRQPLKKMNISGGALNIPAGFPYSNRIDIHTTARQLHLHSYDDSRLQLSGQGDTLHLEMLELDAHGHSTLLAPTPISVEQAILHSDDFATLRYRDISSPDLRRHAVGESRMEQMGVEDQEEAYDFHLSPRVHVLFGGASVDIGGWSEAPFGGMSVPMGDYTMTPTAVNMGIRLGWNFFRRSHWDFGIGIGFTVRSYKFPHLMGTTVDPATGLTHLGPIDEPNYYNHPSFAGQTRTWRSNLSVFAIGTPLRVEWHKRMDYKGLRISAELRPYLQLGTLIMSEGTWTHGNEADHGRVDVLTDSIANLFNLFGCDLRFDIGWGHLSLYIQGALTPLFRTARKDDHPALDTKIYPLSIGLSVNY